MKRRSGRELRKLNSRIAKEFAESHPARMFLLLQREVRREVCGRDVDLPGRPQVDLEWHSKLAGRRVTFSEFAYIYISRDVFLIEWFEPAFERAPSPGEISAIEGFRFKLELLQECRAAAVLLNQEEVVRFTDLAEHSFTLEIAAIADRIKTTPNDLIRLYGKTASEYESPWHKKST